MLQTDDINNVLEENLDTKTNDVLEERGTYDTKVEDTKEMVTKLRKAFVPMEKNETRGEHTTDAPEEILNDKQTLWTIFQ